MNKKANIDYLVPFNSELKELGYKTYRTNQELMDKITYLFSHPKFKHRVHFNKILNGGSKSLAIDMANRAVNITRHFIDNKQQYGSSFDNIHWQILTRMWRQTYKHSVMQRVELLKYKGTQELLLNINNGLMDCLLDTVIDDKYIEIEGTRKYRKGLEHTERRKPTKHLKLYEVDIDELCDMADNECSSLL